jgi:hypothetical protein
MLKYQISLNFAQWDAGVRTDTETKMLIAAFRNIANAPKNYKYQKYNIAVYSKIGSSYKLHV